MTITDDEKAYWLALWRVPRVGPVLFHKLLEQFGNDLPRLFVQSSVSLRSLGLRDAQIEPIKQFQRDRSLSLGKAVDQDLRWLDSASTHNLLLCTENAYPRLLKEVAGAPPLLFAKGDTDVLAFPQIAIVGSRNPTRMGKDCAFNFAQHFAKQGFVTTSGLAMGIDGAAHQGALVAEGYTVAVLAHGLDQIYPRSNQGLADNIESNGVLVSEYPIGVGPRAEYFPRRNRIVSGMSLGVLVVEAAKKSGSLITAGEAVQQGREVFAIPGSIHNPLAKGCHELIRQGAKLVENGEHVVEELLPLLQTYQLDSTQLEPSVLSLEKGAEADVSAGSAKAPGTVSVLSARKRPYGEKSTEAQILSVLEHEACSVDFVVSETGLGVAEVNSGLIMLELEGAIVSSKGRYLLA